LTRPPCRDRAASVKAHVPGRAAASPSASVERGTMPRCFQTQMRAAPSSPTSLHGTDAFGGRLYDGQRIRRRRDAVLGQRQEAAFARALGYRGDNGDPCAARRQMRTRTSTACEPLLEHRRRDQQRNGARSACHERSGARLVALDASTATSRSQTRIASQCVTGCVLEELAPGSPADPAAPSTNAIARPSALPRAARTGDAESESDDARRTQGCRRRERERVRATATGRHPACVLGPHSATT